MRKSALIAFAFTLVLATNSVLQGQTQSKFVWRSSESPKTPRTIQPVFQAQPNVQNQPIVQKAQPIVQAQALNQTQPVQLSQQQTTAPTKRAAKKRRPFLVSFGRKQDETQSSVSDVDQIQNAPATPGADAPQISMEAFEEPTMALPGVAPADAEANYCDRNCKKECCLGCERKLFGTSCRGLEVGGWASIGYHNRNYTFLNALNNRKAEGNLHQVGMYFDKSADRCGGNWDWGYRADLVYGIDGQDLQAFGNAPTGAPAGWDNSWDYGSYGWALPQAYVQFANADWDVKLGKFYSPFGYESVGATENFFYSHSYTMYNTEPFTMSGVLAERRLSSTRSVIVGATAGWDTGFDNNNGGNLITGLRFRPNEYVDVAMTSSIGDTGARGSGVMSSFVAQMQLTNDLKYVFQADSLNIENNQEFGLVNYMFRDVNECLALGARLEWWKSDQFFANTRSSYNFTMGANYRANANITLRPELRWDWGAAATDPGSTIIGFDAVMTF